MFNYSDGLDGMRAMTRLSTTYQTMAIAAGEVFFRRSLMIASGSMSASDALAMVVEKAATFAEAAGEATSAVARGENLIGVAAEALGPYEARTAANVRHLRG